MTELEKLKAQAKQKALADVMGCSNSPFAAVAWRKTLPKEYQAEVEEVIVDVYHNT
jgi:hypothetical protein